MFPSVISEGVLIKRRPSSHALLMGTSERETVIMIALPIEKPTRSRHLHLLSIHSNDYSTRIEYILPPVISILTLIE